MSEVSSAKLRVVEKWYWLDDYRSSQPLYVDTRDVTQTQGNHEACRESGTSSNLASIQLRGLLAPVLQHNEVVLLEYRHGFVFWRFMEHSPAEVLHHLGVSSGLFS